MPIAPHLRYLYSTPEWKEKRRRALERAGNKCNRCRIPNHTAAERLTVRSPTETRAWWRKVDGKRWYDEKGRHDGAPYWPPHHGLTWRRWTLYVTLTVAHVDHDPENMEDQNLEALCCRCHILHDRELHTKHSRITRQIRKDAGRPLLVLAEKSA